MYKNKISAVYKIVNTVTGDFYIGSSCDVKRRWRRHKAPSTWENCLNNPLYLDMQKYGSDKFNFHILAPVIPEHLKQVEQELIEMLNPTYNNRRAVGMDDERINDYRRNYVRARNSQLCQYNGRLLTLGALYVRFKKARIKNPFSEAKKYLLTQYLLT